MCNKIVESKIPEGVRLQVVHLHTGNSKPKQRRGRQFATVAYLYKDNVMVGMGKAFCSEHDAPSRKIGRAVAVGRALKNFQGR